MTTENKTKKTFKIVWDEIKEKSGSGFSKKQFAELTSMFLNESEYELVWVKGYDSDMNPILGTSKPVKKFREILVKILVKAKVDRQDAEAIVSAYDFSRADGEVFYEVFSEIMEQYLRTGKNFKTPPKEDLNFNLSLALAEDKVYKGSTKALRPDNPTEYETKVKGCYKVRVSNRTPKNLKIKIK